jgi:hypothetical protein
MSMEGPLGALQAGLTASTTKVEEDIDGGPLEALSVGPVASTTEVEDNVDDSPPGVRCGWVRQRPPPRLKKTSMAGPLGSATGGSDSVHHRG